MDLAAFAAKILLVVVVAAIIVAACGTNKPITTRHIERFTYDGIECVAYKDPFVDGITCNWSEQDRPNDNQGR